MSRISGMCSQGADRGPIIASTVRSMGHALKADKHWTCELLSHEQVAFAWSGTRSVKMTERDGVLVAVDGMIYNRSDLGGSGLSDAALFAQLFLDLSFEDALKAINGDFALSLYDSRKKTLWLARDRLGLKPLYFAQTEDSFAFASSPRTLLKVPGVGRDVDPAFVGRFGGSHYRYIDNEPASSPYRDVAQLEAGHWLRYENGKILKGAFWQLSEKSDLSGSEDELADQYRSLLDDAVSIRLQAAKNPTFTLSGGMDSSSVLAFAVKRSGRKQHAFSTVYTDKTYDESEEIRSMLDANVRQWHSIRVDEPNLFETVSKMIATHQEPVATATWLAHYQLCDEISKAGFDGMFGGLGGDELNAGEFEYFPLFFADLRVSGQEEILKKEVAKWIQYHDHRVFKKSCTLVEDLFSRIVDLSQPGLCKPERKRMTRYAEVINPELLDVAHFEPKMPRVFDSYLKNRTFQDIFLETAPCCLRAEDRHTSRYGLDNFLPFYDHRLVEFMYRIPGTLKIRDGVTKYLLRLATRGVLPEETRTRVKKMGWNAPVHLWFSGRNLEPLWDLVRSTRFRSRGIYNVDQVERVIREHDEIVQGGLVKDNHMMFLWQLLNLELWLEYHESTAI